MCVIKNHILQWAMRLWNLEQDHRVDSSSFPRQVQHKMAWSIQETCMVLAFGHMELLSQMPCNRIPHWGQQDQPPMCFSRPALAVTDFWYLHGQLQALAGLVAGFKEAAVHVTGQVAIIAWMALIWGRVVPVRGAAQVDAHRFTCVREHEEAVQELAKETGEDQGGTLLCLKKEKIGTCESKNVSSVCGDSIANCPRLIVPPARYIYPLVVQIAPHTWTIKIIRCMMGKLEGQPSW